MSRYWVELSGENLPLARAEAGAASEALGGGPRVPDSAVPEAVLEVELADREAARALGGRLALAHRVLSPTAELTLSEAKAVASGLGADRASAAVRLLGSPGGSIRTTPVEELARAYRAGGGVVDLERPQRTVYAWASPTGRWVVCELVAVVDRSAFEARRMPRLSYRRPVSLPPRRARAAMNLARVRPGDRVVDPFVGTGALLLEAALLGAQVCGVDRDAGMVRGALRNFASMAAVPARLAVADAAEAFAPPSATAWDAVVTDPPYGRASSSGPERPAELLARVLPRWAELVRPGGRFVVVAPVGTPAIDLGEPWRMVVGIPDRVHRSLTREFRVYERRGGAPGSPGEREGPPGPSDRSLEAHRG